MDKKTFDVEYPAGHSYEEQWEQADIYCVNCGTKQVWVEEGEGDYYAGPRYLCTGCGVAWSYNGFSLAESCPEDRQRIRKIRGEE
jgi:transposase-like protein